MGTTWAKGSANSFQGLPELILKRLRARMQEAMEEVIQQAVMDMKRFTETRPSANSGKSGRVDTGEMLNAIAGRVLNEGADRIVGEFGFLDRQELYYALQTSLGFQHINGAFIDPTYAQRDAQVAAIERLLSKLGEPL